MSSLADTKNPHNIYAEPRDWARFEYKNGRGSMAQLLDYAKRQNLIRAVRHDPAVSETVQDALAYLLGERQ